MFHVEHASFSLNYFYWVNLIENTNFSKLLNKYTDILFVTVKIKLPTRMLNRKMKIFLLGKEN